MDPKICTITLVQFTETSEQDEVLARMRPFFESAVAQGSDLIVFPEYTLSAGQGRVIAPDHDNVKGFCKLADAFNINAVAGLVEAYGESYATTALTVDRNGKIIGRYLKMHAAAGVGEHCWPPISDTNNSEAYGYLGSAFKVFNLDFARVGIIQCYDGAFPESWGCTAALGAEIILWINGRADAVQDAYCISASHAYACIVGANVSDGFNTGFAEPRADGCIISEHPGRETMRLHPRIAKPGDDSITATIDLNELRRIRKHLRTQHQRRPDCYAPITQPFQWWLDYPEIPWEPAGAEKYVNKASAVQLKL